jgi:hypothetical protein
MIKKNTLDLAGITAKCDYLVNANLPYYQQFNEAFVVLRLTGCRVSELFEIDRWSHLGDDVYSLQPQKGNTLRVVQLNTDCSDFQAAIQNQVKPFGGLTKYQLYNVYDRVKGWDLLQSGEKDISLYVFRYRYTKQLYADGYDVPTIAAMLGYTNTLTVQSYLLARVSEVFIKPPVGFVDVGGIWISQDNFAITDDGSGIYDFRGGTNLWLGRHYTTDAIMRVLAWLGVYRLPTREEWLVIRDYCYNKYGYQAACAESNLAKWLSLYPYMQNAFELQIGGAGYVGNNVFKRFRVMGMYHVAPSTLVPSSYLYFYYKSPNLSINQNPFDDAFSVRVVLA